MRAISASFIQVAIACVLLSVAYNVKAACTTTISTGTNVATTVSNASAGDTVCLNSGSYGSVTFSGISKASDVIIQSTTGVGASITPTISNGSNHLKFDHLTMPGGFVITGSTTKNITISASDIGDASEVVTTNMNANNILIDGNTFDGIAAGTKEGRLAVYWPGGPGSVSAGVTITNNHFGGGGCSDGVELGAYGVVVGPGNIFEEIRQGSCTEHVDSIQGYGQSHSTVNGNFFDNVTVCLGFYDGGNTETFTNNIMIGHGSPDYCVIDLGSITSMTFEHNTIKNASTRIGAINEAGATSGIIRNNLWINSSWSTPGAGFTGTTSYNAFSGVSTIGTNTESGTPTFTGGATPTTWAGWELTSGSAIGYQTGSDGQDRGTTYYGSAVAVPVISALTCSPTSVQTPSGTTDCTVTASNSPTSYSYSFTSCTAAACTTSDTDSVATVTCSYGGACTPCATATNSGGTSDQYCATAGYLTAKARKGGSLKPH